MAELSARPLPESWSSFKSCERKLSEQDADGYNRDSPSEGNSSDGTRCPVSSNDGRSSDDTRAKVSADGSGSGNNSGNGGDSEELAQRSQKAKTGRANGSGASPAATAASHDKTQYASLKHNGPSHSNGSSHHDEGSCKPCAFYCFSKSGCFRGDDCKFCHLFHQSRTLRKRDVWVSSHQPSHQEGLDVTQTHEAKYDCGRRERCVEVGEREAAGRNGRHRRVAFEAPPAPTLYVPDSEISLKSSLPTFAPVSAAGKSKTQGTHTNSHIPENFAYMPSGAERVGQKVSLFPLIHDALPRVFAVAPELPQGLTIDKRTGVIHGTPQEATNGPIPYFVTSCDPCGNFGVSTAMVCINVLSASAPGCSAGEVLHEPGVNMAASNEEMSRAREKVQQELVAQLTLMTMQLHNTSYFQQSHN